MVVFLRWVSTNVLTCLRKEKLSYQQNQREGITSLQESEGFKLPLLHMWEASSKLWSCDLQEGRVRCSVHDS